MTTTTRAGRMAAGAGTLLLLAACAAPSVPDSSSARSSTNGRHTMADGATMSDQEMQDMDHSEADAPRGADEEATVGDETAPAPGAVTHREHGPSAAAAMICSLEIAQAIQGAFALPNVPTATDGWHDRAYTCTYQLPAGHLALSVQDLDREPAGRDWFDALSQRLDRARPITGLQSLGFPAVETPGSVGSVAFLKDHKTLWVDAGDVAATDLPPGFNRTAGAYSIAAHVIACWEE